MKKKRLLIVVAVVIVIISVAAFVIIKKDDRPAAPADSKAVGMMKVALGENTSDYVLPGEFVPKYQAEVGFQVGGRIVNRYVSLGDTVKSGQVLYRLESADYDLKLAAANSRVAAAQSEFELQSVNLRRAKELLGGAAIPQSTYDQQYTAYKNASDNLNAAISSRDETARQVGYTDLTAPGDAVVMQIVSDVGSVVNEGAPVVKLGYLKEWDVQVFLSEQQRIQYGVGSPVRISTWVTGIPDMTGTIREIAGSADPDTRTFRTRITLDQRPPNLHLGMTCSVNLLPAQQNQQIFIPLEALVNDNTNKPYVWVVENGVAHKRNVTLGRYGSNNNIAVTAGLIPGETIITAGVITITDGTKVVIWNEQSRQLGW